MNKIKMYHAELPNMGDLLNVLLMEEYFKFPMERKTPLTAELSGIGSGLGQFTVDKNNLPLAIVKQIFGKMYPTVHIWGTGFIEDKDWGPFYRKKMVFHALRGKLTKQKVEKILGHEVDIPLGDGGILAPYLVESGIEQQKRYRVGIIPHFKEQDHPIFQELINQFPDSKLIDLKEEPHQVIREIAQCEVVISSSLHGLIVADAFYVPNIHIVVTDNLLGDGFKFDDYYSAYDLAHHSINVLDEGIDWLTEAFIKQEYRVTRTMVDQAKQRMSDAFPYKRWEV
ncbi:polysaccharide pyruvyl transferase family protein [Candidatus Enterococcus courvalinii]|uniref:Polysaccharide pyruvyl transferase family protein n=1 Tax=Candidatus Enterococcus courvalinii TaxID=2815329 RepID=A0ABS3HX82_9ENTE|nr:polysaccharide pyruvyl transferase family protein [Enterococcus sp. MSG2901]MBO0481011.1 polysaccharide pyruvyl transferase family protein [Enterococcus sp. MSG2901]